MAEHTFGFGSRTSQVHKQIMEERANSGIPYKDIQSSSKDGGILISNGKELYGWEPEKNLGVLSLSKSKSIISYGPSVVHNGKLCLTAVSRNGKYPLNVIVNALDGYDIIFDTSDLKTPTIDYLHSSGENLFAILAHDVWNITQNKKLVNHGKPLNGLFYDRKDDLLFDAGTSGIHVKNFGKNAITLDKHRVVRPNEVALLSTREVNAFSGYPVGGFEESYNIMSSTGRVIIAGLEAKIIASRKSDVSCFCYHNGEMFDAGSYGIHKTFSGEEKPLFDFLNFSTKLYPRHMTSVPCDIWNQIKKQNGGQKDE
jgi:hypothetical protein